MSSRASPPKERRGYARRSASPPISMAIDKVSVHSHNDAVEAVVRLGSRLWQGDAAMLWPIVLFLIVWCFIQQRALERLRMALSDLQALPRWAPRPAPAAVPPPADPDDPYEQIRRALDLAKARDPEMTAPPPEPEPPPTPVLI